MPRLLPLLPLALMLSGVARAATDAPACPQTLRIGFNDSAAPPMLMGQGAAFADPPGWEVDAVHDALKRMGCRADLVRLPSRRLNVLLAQGDVDIAMLYGTTPERLKTLRFPLDAKGRPDPAWAPVFGHLTLFARPGTPPSPGWSGGQLPANWRVGVVTGSVQETVARERGWPVEPINAFELSLTMLHAQRFDLLLTSREALSAEQRAGLVEWALAARLPFYAPAAPAFMQHHGAWTRTFWKEICHAVRRQAPEVRPVDCGTLPPATGR